MITSKEVIAWMVERLEECHKRWPTGLPPGPRFIDSNGKEHPVFGTVKCEGKEEKLIIGLTKPPFLTEIPLKKVVLKNDRSSLAQIA